MPHPEHLNRSQTRAGMRMSCGLWGSFCSCSLLVVTCTSSQTRKGRFPIEQLFGMYTYTSSQAYNHIYHMLFELCMMKKERWKKLTGSHSEPAPFLPYKYDPNTWCCWGLSVLLVRLSLSGVSYFSSLMYMHLYASAYVFLCACLFVGVSFFLSTSFSKHPPWWWHFCTGCMVKLASSGLVH